MLKNFDKAVSLGRGESGGVYCPENAKHVFVSGTTGSGKTVVLSNFVEYVCKNNYPALLIDGKGDIGNGSLLEITKNFCKQYNKKLYVIDLIHPRESEKYNPFQDSKETIAKDMIINLSEWSEQHYKSNTERFIQRLFKLLELSGIKLSFESITANCNIEAFEILSSKLLKAEKITKNEHLENIRIVKASGEIAENAGARFATLSESEAGLILKESGIDIYRALKQNAIIIFVLSPLLYPELSPVFGRLVLIDAKKAVSKLFANNDKRIFYIFDEINVYASPILVDLVNKSRSANITCILATQSLADLEFVANEAFKRQIIENCNNYIILRTNDPKGAEELAKIAGTREKVDMTFKVGGGDLDKGSAKKVRGFIFHPDDIKEFKAGEGLFISKDFNIKTKVLKFRKPF